MISWPIAVGKLLGKDRKILLRNPLQRMSRGLVDRAVILQGLVIPPADHERDLGVISQIPYFAGRIGGFKDDFKFRCDRDIQQCGFGLTVEPCGGDHALTAGPHKFKYFALGLGSHAAPAISNRQFANSFRQDPVEQRLFQNQTRTCVQCALAKCFADRSAYEDHRRGHSPAG